jgi:hypothetical protein
MIRFCRITHHASHIISRLTGPQIGLKNKNTIPFARRVNNVIEPEEKIK